YATDATYSAGSDATVNNRVAKITEKGYYFYNGTEWVKSSSGADGREWKFNGTDAIVAQRANTTGMGDLIQVKNGKGLQQFVGSPDPSVLVYKEYNSITKQVEDNTIFKSNADLKSIPNFKYITSDALADTSVFEKSDRPNNKVFTSDYKLFQFKPNHLDRVTTGAGQATYVPYYRAAYFNNIHKPLFDIWLNRDYLYMGDNSSDSIEHIGGHEVATMISGSNPIGETRGIDVALGLMGSNTIGNISGIRSIIENTYGFTGKVENLYGSRNIINFRGSGNVNQVFGSQTYVEVPTTSNSSMKDIYANVLGITYQSQNTTAIGNIISNKIDTNLNTVSSTKVVQAVNASISSKSEVTESQTSAWFSNTFDNNKTNTQLNRMDGVVISNNYKASAPVKNYSGVVVHNKVSAEAIGNITALNGININNEIADGKTSQITDNYGVYINDIKGATRNNHAIHTGVGNIRFGDLASTNTANNTAGVGDKPVFVTADGVLKVGTASTIRSAWVPDTASNSVQLAITSANGDRTTHPISITDDGMVRATSFQGVNGATIFPDYVFQKYYTGTSSIKADYNFKSLSQVEDFVKTNGHLPGYKSAATIKAQGYVDLMETQLTNVEKIEELYLHSIEQDKVNKQQAEALRAKDAEIADLKQRLERLEKLIQ
ncbi:hypothetical protein HMPREF9699_00429, partial [Bergeyella zoohelcum ATCC 43767]